MPDTFGGQKKLSDLLELELGAVVSCHVVAGNQMQAFAKGLTSPAPGRYVKVSMGPLEEFRKTDLARFVVYLFRFVRERLDGKQEGLRGRGCHDTWTAQGPGRLTAVSQGWGRS